MCGTLLFADGDETTLIIYQQYFTDRGYCVYTACTGLTCLTLMEELHPDLVILDDGLLWGGSEGVLSRLRIHPESYPPSIILTCGDGALPEKTEPLAVTRLQKPLHLNDLHNAITAELARTPGQN
jgi:DNA-binding response OmpR family regulator